MDGNNQQGEQNFELPKTQPEAEQTPAVETGERVFRNVENQSVPSNNPDPATANNAAVSAASDLAAPGSSFSLGDPPSAFPQSQDQALAADDADLIEKEWVDKAKQIVEKTKDDPYKQNQEMSKVKAQYIQKRWHKQIKLSDDISSA